MIVTEPTPSGLHDLERVAALCEHFRIRVAVIVNKHDLNPDHTAAIEELCRAKGYALAGRLPHDTVVTEAMVARKAVTELEDEDFGRRVRDAWTVIQGLLNAN
ncbi:hypothetical protein DSECCO2_367770 [anaerobic digester metagenome]